MSTALLTRPLRVRAAVIPPPRESTAGDGRTAVARISRLVQVMLGLLWVIDGVLPFQPYMFGKTFITGVLLPNAAGQPGIIGAPITWIARLIEPNVALFNGFAGTLQVLIGLGLLYPRTVKPALLVSFVWAIGIWFTGEGLGMILTGNASPLTGAPGAALLYVLVPRRKSSLVGCTWVIGARRRAFRIGDRLLMSAARMALPAPGQRERDGLVVAVR